MPRRPARGAHTAERTLRRERHSGRVSTATRTLLSCSVDFDRPRERSSKARRAAERASVERLHGSRAVAQEVAAKTGGEAPATAEPKDENVPPAVARAERERRRREERYGSFSDAKECTFKPRRKKSEHDDVKRDDDGNEIKQDFVGAQFTKLRATRDSIERAREEQEYMMRQDRKKCPSCGTAQRYDEYVNKRTKCERCSDALGYDVYYEFMHGVWSKVQRHFFRRLDHDNEWRESQRKERAAELRNESKQDALKKVFDESTGRIKEVPLFRPRNDEMWNDFEVRLAHDVETRAAKQRTWREISALNNAANELGADGKVKKVRGALNPECTFQPKLATRKEHKDGDDDDKADAPIDIDAFVERQMDDAAKRKRYFDEIEEEERARVCWFDEYTGLRDTTTTRGRGGILPDDF